MRIGRPGMAGNRFRLWLFIPEHIAQHRRDPAVTIAALVLRIDRVDALLERERFPGEKLDEILSWDGSHDIFADLVDRYILRAGISGVQPKVLVPEQQNSTPQRFT